MYWALCQQAHEQRHAQGVTLGILGESRAASFLPMYWQFGRKAESMSSVSGDCEKSEWTRSIDSV